MKPPVSARTHRVPKLVATAVLTALVATGLTTAGAMGANAAQRPLAGVTTGRLTMTALRAGPATSSGGYLYRAGRYTALGSFDGLPTGQYGINDRGQITGTYTDAGALHGFVRDANGHYTTFDAAPGSPTAPFHINDQGTVVGAYSTTAAHGFVRRPNGTVTTVDVPGARGTLLYGVNDHGAVVGQYVDANGLEHGFELDHGVLTRIDPPGSPAVPGARDTSAFAINDRGQVAGYYADRHGTYHGYRYDHGRFTLLDDPRAADVPDYATTVAFGINNDGEVVGQYVDGASVLHGFRWRPGYGYTTIDPPQTAQGPGGTPGSGTVSADINDRGQILLPAPGILSKGRAVSIS